MRIVPLVLLATLAAPATAADPAGLWALRAQDRTLMYFDVEHGATGWTATWTQPADYRTRGVFFSDLAAGTRSRAAREARVTGDEVDLVFAGAQPGWGPDRIVIRPTGTATASMRWAAFAAVPYRLIRVAQRPSLGPWDDSRSYVADADRPTNAEMTALFEGDQGDRADPAHLDWAVILPRDRMRLKQTQALVDGGALSNGDDFYHAAYVFQHGEKPDDFLKAHVLATIAMARGRPDAVEIAAMTLDRYLQRIGKPQIYGTQFNRSGATYTLDPYDRDLLSDPLRVASHVAPLAEQQAQAEAFDRMMPLPRP